MSASTGKIPFRPRGSVVDQHVEEIERLTAAGWRLGRIAAKLGIAKQTLWTAMKRRGMKTHPPHSAPGENNPAWRGGRWVDRDGYVMIYAPDHPRTTSAGYLREHRLVMEQVLGRLLSPSEVVHHKDGDRGNNRPSNLEVFAQNGTHLAQTLKGRVPKWTDDGKRRISQGVRQALARRRAANRDPSGSDDRPSPK